MIKQSRDREQAFRLFPTNKAGNLYLERRGIFKVRAGEREVVKAEGGIEARSPGSLLGGISLSPWIHTWGEWEIHKEVPVSWGLPHVSKEIEEKCSQTGSSLQAKQEVINQDSLASTHWTVAAKFGKASPDCCPAHPLEPGKRSLSAIIHSEWYIAIFVRKIFSISPSYTSSSQPQNCCCLKAHQMFTLKSGGVRNGCKGKWITEKIVFLSWHLYFLVRGSGNWCSGWGRLFVWNTTAHAGLLACGGTQVSCGVRFAQPSEMQLVISLGTSYNFLHVRTY